MILSSVPGDSDERGNKQRIKILLGSMTLEEDVGAI